MHDTFATLRRVTPHLLAVAGLIALPALAQGVYRIVGPDGRVSYSDQPPPASSPARPVSGTGAAAAPAATAAALPFELRRTSSRYPVTLYTSAECNPCKSAIAYLERRGIPFTEKTVQSNADIQALQRISGETSLPLLTVGSQQLRGFFEADWKQYLDAAGYPAQSALPAGYRRPAATPMVAAAEAPPPSAPAPRRQPGQGGEPAAADAPPAAPPVTPPAGIRF